MGGFRWGWCSSVLLLVVVSSNSALAVNASESSRAGPTSTAPVESGEIAFNVARSSAVAGTGVGPLNSRSTAAMTSRSFSVDESGSVRSVSNVSLVSRFRGKAEAGFRYPELPLSSPGSPQTPETRDRPCSGAKRRGSPLGGTRASSRYRIGGRRDAPRTGPASLRARVRRAACRGGPPRCVIKAIEGSHESRARQPVDVVVMEDALAIADSCSPRLGARFARSLFMTTDA